MTYLKFLMEVVKIVNGFCSPPKSSGLVMISGRAEAAKYFCKKSSIIVAWLGSKYAFVSDYEISN